MGLSAPQLSVALFDDDALAMSRVLALSGLFGMLRSRACGLAGSHVAERLLFAFVCLRDRLGGRAGLVCRGAAELQEIRHYLL